ncbi:MAG: LysE family transporter [Endomicrobium sp.]|jgi:threonine/homoserine/homoserine lactone efflux protein|nr:LysE family transporter [Endomicrobium sp.]
MNLSVKNANKLFRDGLRIGLLLQVGGIGPICMLVFRLSLSLPIAKLLVGIVGITLADVIYTGLAVLSISAIMKKIQGYQRIFDIVVGIALMVFGVLFITAGHVVDSNTFQGHDLFFWLFGLTIANPITILFITGIFSLEISKRNMNLKESGVFAFGFSLAAPIFLTFVASVGSLTGKIFPSVIIQIINTMMGFVLVFLGARNIFFKGKKKKLPEDV